MSDEPHPGNCGSADALRSASLSLVAASIVVAGLMVVAARAPVSFDGIDILAWIVATMFILSLVLNSRHPRLADGFGSVGQAWLGGLASCAVAVAGLRLGMPRGDGALLSMDRAIGVDGAAVLAWTRHQPGWFVDLLAMSYGATVAFVFISLVLLSIIGDRLEVWRSVMCFLGSVLTTCFIAAFAPALGMSAWVSPALLTRLSAGSPRHFWPQFAHFRDFHERTGAALSLDSLGSCVTFPSFHAIMGLIVVAMWRKRTLTFLPACIWLALMLFSTLPFGGHYAVDLLGGAAVWSAWFALSRRAERKDSMLFASFARVRLASSVA